MRYLPPPPRNRGWNSAIFFEDLPRFTTANKPARSRSVPAFRVTAFNALEPEIWVNVTLQVLPRHRRWRCYISALLREISPPPTRGLRRDPVQSNRFTMKPRWISYFMRAGVKRRASCFILRRDVDWNAPIFPFLFFFRPWKNCIWLWRLVKVQWGFGICFFLFLNLRWVTFDLRFWRWYLVSAQRGRKMWVKSESGRVGEEVGKILFILNITLFSLVVETLLFK